MKKVIEVIFVSLLVLFSFYYTEKAIVLLESNDPIMKEIKDKGSGKEEAAINAKVEGDYLIPGYNGLVIDLEESFRIKEELNSIRYGHTLKIDDIQDDD